MMNKEHGKQVTRSKRIYAGKVQEMEMRLQAEDAKGSTGSKGKRADNDRRNGTRIAQGKRIDDSTVRAMKGDKWDDRLKLDGRFYNVETKSTFFAQWAYGCTEEIAWARLEEMRHDEKLVLEILYEGVWTMFRAVEFFDALEAYKPSKGLTVWFDYKAAAKTNARGGQLQMQPVQTKTKVTSAKRKAYLEKLIWEIGFDADTIRETLSFE